MSETPEDNPEGMQDTHSKEKLELQVLNGRLLNFLTMVHNLEEQNRALQQELGQIKEEQQQQGRPKRIDNICQEELNALKDQLETEGEEKDRIKYERDSLKIDMEGLQQRLELETQKREDAEKNLIENRKEVDRANLQCGALRRKIKTLQREIEFLKKVYDEDIDDVVDSLQLRPRFDVNYSSTPDLSGTLRDIRAEYEKIARRNTQKSEEWYRSKFADLTEYAKKKGDALREAKQEANKYKRQSESLCREIEALKIKDKALVKQMHEREDQFRNEISSYQCNVARQEEDIGRLREEIARHRREYGDLSNKNIALDWEIATYRRLLDGQEGRMQDPAVPREEKKFWSNTDKGPDFNDAEDKGSDNDDDEYLSGEFN